MSGSLKKKPISPFTRRKVRLSANNTKQKVINSFSNFSALVINSSEKMAKEITQQLSLILPNCSIIYAPSIEIAKLILRRRKIDLLIASPVLVDGGVIKLRQVLNSINEPPDLIIVTDHKQKITESLEDSAYRFAQMKCFKTNIHQAAEGMTDRISSLGADLRNDLNNPLQEIVAMVFVAKASGKLSPATEKSLEAINCAAKNMSEIVWGLEDKIKIAVDS